MDAMYANGIPFGTDKDSISLDEFSKTYNHFKMSNSSLHFKLYELMQRLDGADKCTVCEAMRELDKSADGGWNGSFWILLIFLIFSGFGNNSNFFDLEAFSKVLNESIAKAKESDEEGE